MKPGHLCHALDCDVEVPPHLLMCRRHWRMVPEALQRDVWSTYRPGQERDKRPSPEYRKAARAAMQAVAERESSQPTLL